MRLSCGIVFLVVVVVVQANEEVIVKISNGPIRGVQSGKIFSFKGIPYAEPPVGDKRFEPVEINRKKWSVARNATEYGSICIQMSHFTYVNDAKIDGEEDCLTINIFTTSLDIKKRLPVFVFIHGGAFMFGGAVFHEPLRLLEEHEAVFATINYRLGAIGFLSTEDEVVPGNMGLKDQVVALQWIRENILHFGGDPTSVTLTGNSAGGASVHLHYFSQQSTGLFHRGFSQSGCALNPWVLAENSKNKVKTIADKLGCPVTDSKKMIQCLKTKPADKIVRGARLFMPWHYNPFSPFGVVIEKKGSRPFLTEHPEDLLRTGKVAQLPWIVSLTENEGLYPVSELSPLDYLSKYVHVTNYRKQLYHRIFIKYLPEIKIDELCEREVDLGPRDSEAETEAMCTDMASEYLSQRLIPMDDVWEALKTALHPHGTTSTITSIADKLALSTHEGINFRAWCGIVAFAERFITTIHREMDTRHEIEVTDFESLDRRLNGIIVHPKLKEILYIIRS